VTVELDRQGEGAHVEVAARTSLVIRERDFARQTIERIVEHAGEATAKG
jgi:hypothetical protein